MNLYVLLFILIFFFHLSYIWERVMMMAISQIIRRRWHPGIDCSVLSFFFTWSLNIAGGR